MTLLTPHRQPTAVHTTYPLATYPLATYPLASRRQDTSPLAKKEVIPAPKGLLEPDVCFKADLFADHKIYNASVTNDNAFFVYRHVQTPRYIPLKWKLMLWAKKVDDTFKTPFKAWVQGFFKNFLDDPTKPWFSTFGVAPMKNDAPDWEKRQLLLHEKDLPDDIKERFPMGFQDPRAVKIKDGYLIFTSATMARKNKQRDLLDPTKPIDGQRIFLFKADKSFQQVIPLGEIGPERFNKNCSVLPDPVQFIDGSKMHMLLHTKHPGIAVTFVKDIHALATPNQRHNFWNEADPFSSQFVNGKVMMSPREENAWESKHIAASQPPIKIPEALRQKYNTKAGYFLIYHGLSKTPPAWNKFPCYSTGIALLDAKSPWKVVSRPPDPVVETKQIKGKYLSDHVLYPSGGKIYGNNLYLYLGAGDSEIRRTKLNLDAIMQWATQYDAEGKLKGV